MSIMNFDFDGVENGVSYKLKKKVLFDTTVEIPKGVCSIVSSSISDITEVHLSSHVNPYSLVEFIRTEAGETLTLKGANVNLFLAIIDIGIREGSINKSNLDFMHMVLVTHLKTDKNYTRIINTFDQILTYLKSPDQHRYNIDKLKLVLSFNT